MENLKRKLTILITALTILLLYIPVVSVVSLADELTITDNGAGSSNEVTVTSQTTTTVEQGNQANIENNVNTSSETGNNNASDNNGDTTVVTGDANSQTSIENQGNVSQVTNECCPTQGTTATISGNGADSENNITVTDINKTDVSINQTTNISNDVNGQANTGSNQAGNNGGDILISTGDINASGDINNHDINITQVSVEQGEPEILAKISGNGADSENNIDIDEDNQIAVQIDNVANIDNKVNWELSTGNNFASGNLGDVAILTGDINFELNIENGPINLSEVIISCCQVTTSPSPTPTPTPSPTPTPTPTPSPSGGGGGESDGGSSSSSSSSSEAAAGAPGEILGVTTAAGEVLAAAGNNWLMFLTMLGLLSLASGLYFRFGPQSKKIVIKCI